MPSICVTGGVMVAVLSVPGFVGQGDVMCGL